MIKQTEPLLHAADPTLDRLATLERRETSYRQFLTEQRLLAFVYNVSLDACELIDLQGHTTVELASRVPAALFATLMDVLRGAAATGKSFIHRQEVNGRVYTCFGMVNCAAGQVVSLNGFLVPERGADAEKDFLFGRRREDRDSFTGLYTKVAIKTYARNLLESDSKAPVTLCMVDLDYFKEINDTFGHEFGDVVIAKTADILRRAVEGIGAAGRFGGDEFFLVLHKPMAEDTLRAFLRGFRTELEQAFADTPQRIAVHCSVGVASRPANGMTFETLFAKADRGLYIAKQKGRNRYIIYREALHGELPEVKGSAGERLLRDTLHINDTLCVTEEAIDALYRGGRPVLDGVLRAVRRSYEYDGAAVFAGEDLTLLCENGSRVGIRDLAVLKTPEVAALLDASGAYHVNFNQMHTTYLAQFHGLLERHGITTALLYRMGSKEAPRGVLLLYASRKDNREGQMPSDEQRHILGLLAAVIGRTVLAEKEIEK